MVKLITKAGKYIQVFQTSHGDSDSDDDEMVVSNNKLGELEKSIKKYHGDLRKILAQSPIFFTVYINRPLFNLLQEMIGALNHRAPEGMFKEILTHVHEIRCLIEVLRDPACWLLLLFYNFYLQTRCSFFVTGCGFFTRIPQY